MADRQTKIVQLDGLFEEPILTLETMLSSCHKVLVSSVARTSAIRCASSSAKISTGVGTAFDDKNTFPSADLDFMRVHPFRQPIVAHNLSPTKAVPSHIERPPYAATGQIPPSMYPGQILLHDESWIERMRFAARLARRVLDHACAFAKPGLTTDDVDTAVHEAIISENAYPSPLNYAGFKKSLCSSINEVICHGIPDDRPMQNGDIISFDVSCFVGGVHGDNCATIIVGDEQEVDEIGVDWRGVPYKTQFDSPEEEAAFRSGRRLVHATRESLYAAIQNIGPGSCLTDVGAAIHDVADEYGYSSVSKYRGHGISDEFHMAPFVKHFRNRDYVELVPGMIFTIEPMLVEGAEDCFEWSDDWTVVTSDGGMSAQFEHTVLITEDGVEILTLPE